MMNQANEENMMEQKETMLTAEDQNIEPAEQSQNQESEEELDLGQEIIEIEQAKASKEELELEALKRKYPDGTSQRKKDGAKPGLFSAARGGTYHTIDGGASTFRDPEAEARRKAELELYHSMAGNQIITGKCYGIQRRYDETAPDKIHVFATYQHGPFIVYIPIEEYTDVSMTELNKTQRENGNIDIKVSETTARYLQNRLGAEIDLIITNIPRDERGETNRYVLGSRLLAMRQKRIRYWYGKTTDGKDFIMPGDKAEARIVAVARLGIRVEVFGVETYIDYHELTWNMLSDARTMYHVGHNITVKILDINRDPSDDYKVTYTASVKQAAADPRDLGMEMFMESGEYLGVISYIRAAENDNAEPRVFVRLADGVQCSCPWPNSPIPPMEGCEVRVYITHQRKDRKHLYGRILHVNPIQGR